MNKFKTAFRSDSSYKAFFWSIIVFGLSYGLYKGVIDNYLAEIVQATEFDKGVTEFFRELPGLTLVFILAVLYACSAERIYRIGSIVMLVGMAMHASAPATRIWITIAIFIFSAGEHIQLAMRSALSLDYAREGRGGMALGLQNAVYQIGTLLGFIVIIPIFYYMESSQSLFRFVFWTSAATIGLGMIATSRMRSANVLKQEKKRFYFRRKFRKYYMLEVFYGARKQIFFTFGPYVLVLFYGANAAIISLLFAVAALFSFFVSPQLGKIIDRFGYKIVMVSDTLILGVVCFFYGFAHHIFPKDVAFIICCVNYILDAMISLASMATAVYVQDLSDDADEVRATLSTGLSVNHMVTILIALFGGLIWKTLGVETLFVLSAALGLCNSAYAATVNAERDRLLG